MVKLCLVLLLPFLGLQPLHAQKRRSDDKIIMRNGDQLSGEIRSMLHGKLVLRLSYALDDVVLDWSAIESIHSDQRFSVTSEAGTERTLYLDGATHAISLEGVATSDRPIRSHVVEIEPESKSLLADLHGNVDLGYSSSGSNTASAVTLQTNVLYRTTSTLVSLQSRTQLISSSAGLDNDTLVQASWYQQLSHSDFFYGALTSFVSSTQQEIRLRSTTGAGIGDHLLKTARTSLDGAVALAYTDEELSTHAQASSSQEGKAMDAVLALDGSYEVFNRVTLATSAWMFPGITDRGRLRMNLSQSLFYKIARGPYLRAGFYDYFDNKLPSGTPEHNVGGVASVGWSFH